MRRLGECVHDGGYNVTSEILSFLSPAHLPVQITPTRWKRDPESLILFMRERFERAQEEIARLRQRNAEFWSDSDSEEDIAEGETIEGEEDIKEEEEEEAEKLIVHMRGKFERLQEMIARLRQRINLKLEQGVISEYTTWPSSWL